ncbi:MAG: serine hydrolase domain-containing protein, partial [Pseudomonadota bacterium]
MRSYTNLSTIAILTVLAACGQETSNVHEPAPKPEVSYPAPDIPALMAAANIPGLAIAEVNDCIASDASFYGVVDVETGDPVSADTVFEAASLTKTIFSLVVNQLADEGVIDLDEPLSERFEYPRVSDQAGYARLTPRIILAHRSGFPNWAGDPTDEETWGDIDFKNPPDTQFGYSGEAYQLLQAYVEDRTGKTFDELFEERVRARMPRTSLFAPHPDVVTAYGHDKNGGKEDGRALIAPARAGAAFSANSNAG